MKKMVLALFMVLALVVAVSAETLTTASPIGEGKMALTVAGLQEKNVLNFGDLACAWTNYAQLEYGFNKKCDLILNISNFLCSGVPADPKTVNIGGKIKYTIINGGEDQLSWALLGGFSVVNTSAMLVTYTGNQFLWGVLVSRPFGNFVPYADFIYKQNSIPDYEDVHNDLTIGATYKLSDVFLLNAEYVAMMIAPKVGSSYGSGQINLGLGINL
jgi:hypothetical protein